MATKITHITGASKKKIAGNGTIQYVLPLGGDGWVVKSSNATKFTVITDSKREAVSIARGIAKLQHVILEVHGRDGKVEKRESYVV